MVFCEGIEGLFLKSEMWEGLILVVLVGQIFHEYYKGGTMETMMTCNLCYGNQFTISFLLLSFCRCRVCITTVVLIRTVMSA
jgi:hypothetical protein